MAPKPKDVSDDELRRMVQDGKPLVVDFWAPWCQPCRYISPLVEKMASKYDGRVGFAKLNIDDNPESPRQHEIMGVPTLLFFKGGELVDRIVGVVPESRIEESLEKVL